MKNKEVTFRCNDTRFHVKIEDVEVYAQGFAAVAVDLSSYRGFNIVADIGNGTMNVIFIIDGKHFAKLDQSKVRFIEDIHANAKGYEYLSNQRLLRNIRRG